ncbi:MAG: hypothetical protein ACXWG9_14910, partial [Usitatibacter sp.]
MATNPIHEALRSSALHLRSSAFPKPFASVSHQRRHRLKSRLSLPRQTRSIEPPWLMDPFLEMKMKAKILVVALAVAGAF